MLAKGVNMLVGILLLLTTGSVECLLNFGSGGISSIFTSNTLQPGVGIKPKAVTDAGDLGIFSIVDVFNQEKVENSEPSTAESPQPSAGEVSPSPSPSFSEQQQINKQEQEQEQSSAAALDSLGAQRFSLFWGNNQEVQEAQQPTDPSPQLPQEQEEPSVQPTSFSPQTGGNEYLQSHNQHRAKHCVSPLKWDSNLERDAAKYAQACRFDHDPSELNALYQGENLYASTPSPSQDPSPSSVVTKWYNEYRYYNFDQPKFTIDVGHFTQVVWADTKNVGCAQTTCPGYSSPFGKNEDWLIVVCRYSPPGNYGSQVREQVPNFC
eukprot:TRINITY_DN80768_c0_g1_i10.p1 TRINITY_DN80768_c0_g1~~TRINITY_DN80768_c0_g1_i10.p1  ORF type:complete len:322 (+),score=42.28 TRINITY_DN80768_c0_g1_i10:65-1030(+)